MTFFRHPIGPCRNHDDSKVLLVGAICTMIIFTIASAYDMNIAIAATHIDLVLTR